MTLDLKRLFINPKNYNYQLKDRSPAIDSGLPLDVVTTDINGTKRPRGAGYDIGAYEE